MTLRNLTALLALTLLASCSAPDAPTLDEAKRLMELQIRLLVAQTEVMGDRGKIIELKEITPLEMRTLKEGVPREFRSSYNIAKARLKLESQNHFFANVLVVGTYKPQYDSISGFRKELWMFIYKEQEDDIRWQASVLL